MSSKLIPALAQRTFDIIDWQYLDASETMLR